MAPYLSVCLGRATRHHHIVGLVNRTLSQFGWMALGAPISAAKSDRRAGRPLDVILGSINGESLSFQVRFVFLSIVAGIRRESQEIRQSTALIRAGSY